MLHDRIQLTALPNSNNDTYVVLASRVARQWTGIDPPTDRVVTATFRWNPDQSLPASDYQAPAVGDLMRERWDEVISDLPAWDWDVVIATAVSNLGFDLEREILWRSGMSGRGAVVRSWHSRLDYGEFHCCKIEQFR